MDKTTKHDRMKFINELQSKWQKKFRNSKNWLDEEEVESLEELDNFWEAPVRYQSKSHNRKAAGWS